MTALKFKLQANWLSLFINELPIWLIWFWITPYIMYLHFHYSLSGVEKRVENFVRHLIAGLLIVWAISNVVLIAKLLNMGYLEEWTVNNYLPYFGYRFSNDVLNYLFISMIAFSIKIYTTKRQEEIKNLKISLKNNQLNNQLTQAQLQALKLQLNPHFLFNTLNTISSLTLTDQKMEAVEVTNNLSAFLRYTLAFNHEQLVPLQREIAFFDFYLKIEKARFPLRLKVKKEISQASYAVLVPNLILQPLVENAIKHGIGQSKDAGEILLKIECDKGWLLIQLWNDGKPLDKNWEHKINIGLANTIERLNKIYGASYTFNLLNRKGKSGAVAVLRLPTKIGKPQLKNYIS